jgi:hypothetical protein
MAPVKTRFPLFVIRMLRRWPAMRVIECCRRLASSRATISHAE